MSDRAGWSRLLRLFPRAWRERHGAEFLALLAERPPGARDLLDILAGAVDARLRPDAWRPEGQLLFAAAGPPPSEPPSTPGQVGFKPPPERRFTRRTFLRNAVLGGTVVSGATIAGGVAIYAWQNRTSNFGGEVVVPRAEVPQPGDDPHKVDAGKFYLISDADGVLALYWKCPHLGCTVPWNASEDHFHCPCHQSIYDRHGVRIAGPAPRPMDLMALRFDAAGNAIVNTGEITKRDDYSPDQAVHPPA